ncbi:MAG: hypothetical protein IJX08_09315 [Clostridia bacterium]|nr:hypothetical protein [Clostridia bacterium]
MDQDRQNFNEIAEDAVEKATEEVTEEVVEEKAEEMPVQDEPTAPAQQNFYYTPAGEELPRQPEKKGRDHIALILGCVAIGCYLMDSWFGCCCMGGLPALAAVVLAIVSLVLALRHKKQTGSFSDKGVAAVIISAIVLGLCVVSAISDFFSGIFGVLGGIFDALMEGGVEEDFSVRFDFAIKMLFGNF